MSTGLKDSAKMLALLTLLASMLSFALGVAPMPVLLAPAASTHIGPSFALDFYLPAQPASFSVKLSFMWTGGTLDAGNHVLQFLAPQYYVSDSRARSITGLVSNANINLANLPFWNCSGSATLVNGAQYTVRVEYFAQVSLHAHNLHWRPHIEEW